MTLGHSYENLVQTYLRGLEHGDLDAILSLFARQGVVESPLYGTLTAREFYPTLFADTSQSQLTLRATMVGAIDNLAIISFWFDFDWTLANGESAPFTVVDIAELDETGRIVRLHIVYDTAPIRAAFDRR